MTIQEQIAARKADYWARKGKPDFERVGTLACGDCIKHEETKRVANRGPFVKAGDGYRHKDCPWTGGI